jgi:hypothetical protein
MIFCGIWTVLFIAGLYCLFCVECVGFYLFFAQFFITLTKTIYVFDQVMFYLYLAFCMFKWWGVTMLSFLDLCLKVELLRVILEEILRLTEQMFQVILYSFVVLSRVFNVCSQGRSKLFA